MINNAFTPLASIRLASIAIFATLITYALFLLMHYLTHVGERDIVLSSNLSTIVDFVRIEKQKKDISRKQFLPERKQIRKKPQITPPAKQSIKPSLDYGNTEISLPHTLNIDSDYGQALLLMQDVSPVVRILPIYPVAAQIRGIEGWVDVEFAIDKEGNVLNPVVVDAQPTHIFNRASLRAVSKWKYQPQIVNGEAVVRYNIKVTIEYQLEQ